MENLKLRITKQHFHLYPNKNLETLFHINKASLGRTHTLTVNEISLSSESVIFGSINSRNVDQLKLRAVFNVHLNVM